MIPASEALERLRAGNGRFVRGEAASGRARPEDLANGQHPFAIIHGCSDSRVPAEIVFDQGLGDLFVIRVAGNIVAPSHIGSIEFAAERFGTRLVVVLGHSRCGAILATLDELERPMECQSPNLSSIVKRVRPSVEPLLATHQDGDRETLIQAAVRANIRASVANLHRGSPILEQMIKTDGMMIVGADYSLATGEVVFLDDA